MVTIRSSSGIKEDSTLSSVVLPEPVPPDTTIFSRATTHACKNSATSSVNDPQWIRSSTVRRFSGNLRMVMVVPCSADGRHNHMHAGAIRQAGIDHRIFAAEIALQGAHNTLRGPLHMLFVVKYIFSFENLAFVLGKDQVDGPLTMISVTASVVDQRFNRAETQQIVDQAPAQVRPVPPATVGYERVQE